MKNVLLVLSLLLVPAVADAAEREYRPGGSAAAAVWDKFYAGDHEPELDDPLIEAGPKMTLPICEAIRHKDMRLRRYAIGALGYIQDRKALPALKVIAASREEMYYIRGDAILSIYQIDHKLGKTLAPRYARDHEYLAELAEVIVKDETGLLEPTEEQ